ncbi:hypothetical protein SKAU_G00365150 [Synaphobranchus kaupii]|uniref:Ras-GEF domain-containing protein n=1 Tax=Synaphobranchus kaupii TaxID=118154 RepID=A0A9Q1EEY4_SYNKA|nr:hypothetical protein SKAU_G00365150 [Synaphobranchus kaupii]
MPQTLCSSTMFTPSGFSPHLVSSEDPPEEGPGPGSGPGPGPELAEGPLLTSASLDTLIQHLVPTADYYPEVSTSCRQSQRRRKQRALVIEFFIDVARECFNIGNFNSLMAIISGMNMSPVSRLKKTWGKVKTAKFFILEHQMDPSRKLLQLQDCP